MNDLNAVEKEFQLLKEEVQELRDFLIEKMPMNSREEQLYKGSAILFSNLILDPSFLFIGINPGSGYFKQTGLKIQANELEPSECLEYLEYDYPLAKNTLEVFNSTKYSKYLNNTVKTNIFFITTNSQNDLFEFIELVNLKYGINLYDLSKKWILQLIKLIKPKVIICEGKKALEFLCSYYNCEYTYCNDIGEAEILGIKIIGYGRRYSQIINKNELIKKIDAIKI